MSPHVITKQANTTSSLACVHNEGEAEEFFLRLLIFYYEINTLVLSLYHSKSGSAFNVRLYIHPQLIRACTPLNIKNYLVIFQVVFAWNFLCSEEVIYLRTYWGSVSKAEDHDMMFINTLVVHFICSWY